MLEIDVGADRFMLAGGVLRKLEQLPLGQIEELAAAPADPAATGRARVSALATLSDAETRILRTARARASSIAGRTIGRSPSSPPDLTTVVADRATDAMLGHIAGDRVDVAATLLEPWLAATDRPWMGTDLRIECAAAPPARAIAPEPRAPRVLARAASDARWALVLGILSLLGVGVAAGVPAIVLGRRAHRSLAVERRADVAFMASLGEGLGWTGIAISSFAAVLVLGRMV